MQKFRDQLSVTYLKRFRKLVEAPPKVEPTSESDFLREAQLVFGAKLLGALAGAPQSTGMLHDLVRETGIPVRVALKVTQFLEENENVIVLERDDLTENHKLQLTDRGRDSLRT